MIDRSIPVTDDELHAYVDGQLPSDRIAAVEAWLASHPDDMARVATWRAQIEAIRARYGSVADEHVPARFDLDTLASTDRSWRRMAAIAAAVAFLVGGAGGWFAHLSYDRVVGALPGGYDSFTADAMEAYRLYSVEVRHPVEVPASDAQHLVEWLSKRVGYQLSAPNLDAVGLKLVGGRLLPGPTGPAAFFMYENASGERYTLYCGKSTAPDTSLRYSEGNRASAVYWKSDNIAYVISGQSGSQKLRSVANTAYEQIDKRPQRGG
jgi:anti-sigma factor RsiW